jgi:hypothetical protein
VRERLTRTVSVPETVAALKEEYIGDTKRHYRATGADRCLGSR